MVKHHKAEDMRTPEHRNRFMAALALFAVAASAFAQSQTELSMAASAKYRQADQQMTLVWKSAYAAMQARDAQNSSRGGGFGFALTLLDTQRKWLALRDQQCSIEQALFQGGSMAAMTSAQCKTRLTEERTADLRSLLASAK